MLLIFKLSSDKYFLKTCFANETALLSAHFPGTNKGWLLSFLKSIFLQVPTIICPIALYHPHHPCPGFIHRYVLSRPESRPERVHFHFSHTRSIYTFIQLYTIQDERKKLYGHPAESCLSHRGGLMFYAIAEDLMESKA